MVASLDDTGKATNVYRMKFGHTNDDYHQPPASTLRVWNTSTWSTVWDIGGQEG